MNGSPVRAVNVLGVQLARLPKKSRKGFFAERKRNMPPPETWTRTVFPWFAISVGLATLYIEVVPIYRGYQSSSWPTAQGRIEKSSMVEGRSRVGKTYTPLVSYNFMVGGNGYSGHTISYGPPSHTQLADAQSILERYPPGKSVLVCYSPSNPWLSVLEPGPYRSWTGIEVGSAVLLLGLGMLVFRGMVKWRASDAETDRGKADG
jgi:hypothetical protein